MNEKQAGLKLAAQEAVCAAQSGEDGKADPILCSSSVGVDGSTCRTGRQLGVQSDSRCMVILPGGKLEHAKCNIVGDRPKCERAALQGTPVQEAVGVGQAVMTAVKRTAAAAAAAAQGKASHAAGVPAKTHGLCEWWPVDGLASVGLDLGSELDDVIAGVLRDTSGVCVREGKVEGAQYASNPRRDWGWSQWHERKRLSVGRLSQVTAVSEFRGYLRGSRFAVMRYLIGKIRARLEEYILESYAKCIRAQDKEGQALARWCQGDGKDSAVASAVCNTVALPLDAQTAQVARQLTQWSTSCRPPSRGSTLSWQRSAVCLLVRWTESCVQGGNCSAAGGRCILILSGTTRPVAGSSSGGSSRTLLKGRSVSCGSGRAYQIGELLSFR